MELVLQSAYLGNDSLLYYANNRQNSPYFVNPETLSALSSKSSNTVTGCLEARIEEQQEMAFARQRRVIHSDVTQKQTDCWSWCLTRWL
jgi:hypothetical protein